LGCFGSITRKSKELDHCTQSAKAISGGQELSVKRFEESKIKRKNVELN
jgi:hypothetical protein